MEISKVFNVSLIKHPLNWAIVFFMLVIAAIAGHELMSLFEQEPAS
jgi:hypothetical protein